MIYIRNLIKKTGCSETVKIFRKKIISGNRNSTRTETSLIGTAIVSIQNAGSQNKVAGLTLQDGKAGVNVKSVWVMYSEWLDLKEQDLIEREDGFLYEIKNLEPNGRGSRLEHMKSYLVKVDNQDEL